MRVPNVGGKWITRERGAFPREPFPVWPLVLRIEVLCQAANPGAMWANGGATAANPAAKLGALSGPSRTIH